MKRNQHCAPTRRKEGRGFLHRAREAAGQRHRYTKAWCDSAELPRSRRGLHFRKPRTPGFDNSPTPPRGVICWQFVLPELDRLRNVVANSGLEDTDSGEARRLEEMRTSLLPAD